MINYLENSRCVWDQVFLLDKMERDKAELFKARGGLYFRVLHLCYGAVLTCKNVVRCHRLKVICIQISMSKPINAKYVLDDETHDFIGYIKIENT